MSITSVRSLFGDKSAVGAEQAVLDAMAGGWTLKVHRSLDGAKQRRLHGLDGTVIPVDPAVVESLERKELIASNMKFPAATYLLTAKGARAVHTSVEPIHRPV